MANAPNVLQPYWLIVLPLDVPYLTASPLQWGPSGQRWRCLWTFLFSNVSTFATSRLQEILATKSGTTWARNGRWILPENARLPRNIQRSFTFRKSTTRDRRLYFISEGRRAEDFFSPWKIQRLRSDLNPRTWVPKASTLPLDHRSRNFVFYCRDGRGGAGIYTRKTQNLIIGKKNTKRTSIIVTHFAVVHSLHYRRHKAINLRHICYLGGIRVCLLPRSVLLPLSVASQQVLVLSSSRLSRTEWLFAVSDLAVHCPPSLRSLFDQVTHCYMKHQEQYFCSSQN